VGPDHPVTLQELQRRHELLAVLKCYGPFHLVRVLPQVFFLAVAEVVVAELAGNRARARAVVRAWRWNLSRLAVVRRQRRELKAHRRLGDKEIRLLQIGGSARLSTYGRRVFVDGFHGAHADELAAASAFDEPGIGDEISPAFDPDPVAPRSEPGRLGGRTRLTAWLAAALVAVIGTRGVIGGRLPAVGQFVPFPGWSSTLSQFATGWHPSGVGTTAPASPALALAGLVGTVLLGAMGLTQKVMVFACLPIGVWGMARLLRPFRSQRASLIAGLAYLAMALPYNALALGRWGALVVYAGAPWVLARLFRATGIAPFAVPGRRASGMAEGGATAGREPTTPDPATPRLSGRAGRHVTFRTIVALGLIEAVLVSFVPAAAVVVVLAAVALVLSSCLYGEWGATLRALLTALAATVVAAIICLPWLIGVLSAGRGAVAVFGVPVPAAGAASWASLLRFAVGPIGASPLAWGFAVAALVPLVLARGPRFRWAGRLWTLALVFWATAWVIGRGWTGDLAIDPLVLVAPAAAAIAAAIGLGVVTFEEDLRAADFGWRQLVTVVAAGATVLGSVPTLISAVPGRWDLPVNDFSQSVSWMSSKAASGAFRVLWLGDSRSLNQGSWSAGGGLAYATSEDGSPDARWLWNPPDPGPAARLASAVDLARFDRTDQLGRLLAPAGVRYVVLLTSLAPEISGEQSPQQYPVPADLAPALGRQLDLDPVVSGTGITVYANAAWIPERALVPAGTTATSPNLAPSLSLLSPAASPGSAVVAGAEPVLPGPPAARSFGGPVARGTVFTALAPAGRWTLTGSDGNAAVRSSSFGWAGRYRVTAATAAATLRFGGGVATPASLLFSILAWVCAAAFLSMRRLERSWRRVRTGRRRPRSASGDPSADTADAGAPLAAVAPADAGVAP
jgi:hypothetical protein